jgi:menaquinone-specific isochorismate synthase
MDFQDKENFKKNILLPFLQKIKEEFLLEQNNYKYIYRYEIEIKNSPKTYFNPLNWLILQKEKTKVYWSNKDDSFSFSGIGCSDSYVLNIENENVNYKYLIKNIFDNIKIKVANSNENLKYFGCLSFDENDKVDLVWHSFGKIYFFLPKLELYKKNGKIYLACNILFNPNNLKSKKEILIDLEKFFEKIEPYEFNNYEIKIIDKIKYINRKDIPKKQLWIKNIKNIIANFNFYKIKKIVLSRETIFKLKDIIDPILVFASLKKLNFSTYDFYFQNDNLSSFFGCSPELLYLRQDNKIFSEAIAGTILIGKDLNEENKFSNYLLKSKKDSNEYKFVYNSIKNDLNKICSDVKVLKEKEILKLSYVQHIYSLFEGYLKENVDDYKIISVIHPTPAVSGFPKRNIKNLIKKYENYYRGFYSGPVGWISKNSSEFTVGLRSAIINKKTMAIFSGAGIVKESNPENEWNELENKISLFLKLLEKVEE